MKTLLFISALFLGLFQQEPNSILGKWQLIKQTSCLDNKIEMDEESEELYSDMLGMSDRTPQVIHFKEKNNAEESTKIINHKKSYNSKAMLYRFDGQNLYLLDKKSRTIIEGFSVEKFSGDTLIIVNTARACETRFFIKIK